MKSELSGQSVFVLCNRSKDNDFSLYLDEADAYQEAATLALAKIRLYLGVGDRERLSENPNLKPTLRAEELMLTLINEKEYARALSLFQGYSLGKGGGADEITIQKRPIVELPKNSDND